MYHEYYGGFIAKSESDDEAPVDFFLLPVKKHNL